MSIGQSAERTKEKEAGLFTLKPLQSLVWDSRGTFLLETIIASMVFALVGVAVLAGLSTAYTSGAKTEVQSTAENLARNQMESIFSQRYREPSQTPYATISGSPTNFSIDTTVAFEDEVDPDPEVQKISVTARHDGKDILTLETLRGRDDGLQLRYSLSNDRSDSARLEGKTITGTVYVFLDDPELIVDTQTDFYLDGVGPRQTEVGFPWDFEGGDVATADPWDTTSDPAAFNGPHTIMARAVLTDGNTVNVTGNFTISN